MGIVELRQTKNFAKYISSLGWVVEKVDGAFVYIKKIPILGSVMKIQRIEKNVSLDKIMDLAKRHRSFVVYIEPSSKDVYDFYKSNGFKSTNTASLPSKTVRIDLRKNQKTLLSDMHSKTRYNIGLSKRRGVKIVTSRNFSEFARFWQACAKKRGVFLPQAHEIKNLGKAFVDKAAVLNAIYENETVSSVMLLSTDKLLHYMYAASTRQGNKVFAPSLLVWEALTFGKKKKLKYFDFEGIYDERYPLETWKGFSRFKKGFGGEELAYPGQLKKLRLPF